MLGLRCTHPPSHVSYFGSAINMDRGLFNYAIRDGGRVSYTRLSFHNLSLISRATS
jgi:hypothetical protein